MQMAILLLVGVMIAESKDIRACVHGKGCRTASPGGAWVRTPPPSLRDDVPIHSGAVAGATGCIDYNTAVSASAAGGREGEGRGGEGRGGSAHTDMSRWCKTPTRWGSRHGISKTAQTGRQHQCPHRCRLRSEGTHNLCLWFTHVLCVCCVQCVWVGVVWVLCVCGCVWVCVCVCSVQCVWVGVVWVLCVCVCVWVCGCG